MQIIPNPAEAVVLTIPFLVALAGLWFILFKPLLDYLDERSAISETARREADEYGTRMDSRLATLDEQLISARAEISVLRAEARSRAIAHEHKILAEARADAEETIEDAITSINAERERASVTIKVTAETLATDIVDQVLA